jgi:hypothetical protein
MSQLMISFLQIFQNGRRLDENAAVVENEGRHAALRVCGAIALRVLLAAIANEMNDGLIGLEVL